MFSKRLEVVKKRLSNRRPPFGDGSGLIAVSYTHLDVYKRQVYVQAGGGIVADSVPEKEYEESANKAKAVIHAIEAASEVND